MVTFQVMTKTNKGKWGKEKGKYKSYDAAYKAALFYKKKGRKAKVVDLKGKVVTSNIAINLLKYNPFKFLE